MVIYLYWGGGGGGGALLVFICKLKLLMELQEFSSTIVEFTYVSLVHHTQNIQTFLTVRGWGVVGGGVGGEWQETSLSCLDRSGRGKE